MPIYLRRFYLQKLTETKKEEKKQIDKANKPASNIQKPNIRR